MSQEKKESNQPDTHPMNARERIRGAIHKRRLELQNLKQYQPKMVLKPKKK